MKFGMNLLLWTGELNEGLLPVLESLKKMGYDGVELPLFNTSLDYAAWGRRLDDLGLERTAVTVRGEADNPISPDPAVRAAGIENTKRAIDCCQAAAPPRWSVPTIPRWGSSPAKAPRRTSGSGAWTACDRWPTMRVRQA